VLTEREKNSDDAENNTALASAGSNKRLENIHRQNKIRSTDKISTDDHLVKFLLIFNFLVL